jgi:predicted transcriptional regulator
MMFKNISTISASASFDEIVHCLEQSHFNTLPVVDDENQLKGVIRYTNLQNVLFDPALGALVRAEDLAVPSFQMLYPDEPVTRAWQQFRHNNDDSMLVVTREEPHRLLGQLRRRDLLRLFIKSGSAETPSKQELTQS